MTSRYPTVDILLRSNEDWRDGFVLADEADTPLNMTDVALFLHVRAQANDPGAVYIASEENGRITRHPGALYRCVVTNMGSGYTSAPTVGFTGGGSDPGKRLPTARAILGTGADAGKVVAIAIDDAGENMTSAPTIAFTGGGGTSAAATAVIGTMFFFDADWSTIAHLSGEYVQDLVATQGDVRKVMWVGSFTVDDGVTR